MSPLFQSVARSESGAVTVLGYGIVVSVYLNCRFYPALNDPLVGANNHRQFVLFVLTLVFGIVIFDYLTYKCTSASLSL